MSIRLEPERPFGMQDYREVSYSRACELPYWVPSGWKLVALLPPQYRSGIDPYVLYDGWGNILHVWDQEYPPSYVEVMQVCSRLSRRPGCL
jgi:hypothetical protein